MNQQIGWSQESKLLQYILKQLKRLAGIMYNLSVQASSDEKVKYDSGDPTAGYLADKMVAGDGIVVEEGTGADVNKVKISAGGGGSGGGCTDVTYEELVAKIGASELLCGSFYRITDFATVHYLTDGSSVALNDGNPVINTGTAEPLIVMATSANTLSVEAYSPSYPQDLIHYDWNPANHSDCLDFAISTVMITGFKGVITKRHDTILNNHSNHDYRNAKSRVWNVEQPAHAIETSYTEGDFVSYGVDAIIYYANENINGAIAQVETITLTGTSGMATVTEAGALTKTVTFGDDLADTAADFVTSFADDYLAAGIVITNNAATIIFTDNVPGTGFTAPAIANASGNLAGTVVHTQQNGDGIPGNDYRWIKVVKTPANPYVCFNSTSWVMGYNAGTGGSYEIPIQDTEDYEDKYWINDTTDVSKNNYFPLNNRPLDSMGRLPHIVMGDSCNSNTFGNYCYSNTFGDSCVSNTFGDGCYNNTFGDSCLANTFGDYCAGNTFPNSITKNIFYSGISGIDFTAVGITQITDGSSITHQLSATSVYQTYIDSSGETPTMVITTNMIGVTAP